MFGYVKPYPQNLLVREYDYYRAAYCGLCRAMRRHTGQCTAFSLSYEVLLLALVRMLYMEDVQTPVKKRRCVVHPLKKRPMMEENPALLYAAKVSSLLTYYKLKDDIADAKTFRRLLAGAVLPIWGRGRKRAKLSELDAAIAVSLQHLRTLEEQNCPSVDRVAEVFGELLGEVFAFGLEGADATVTRAFGQGLGKFIYIADAIEDYPKDLKSNSYNPFRFLYGEEGITAPQKKDIHTALVLQLCDVEKAMHLLPTEKRDAVIHIIENTVCEGLPKRIEFLLQDQAEQGKEQK